MKARHSFRILSLVIIVSGLLLGSGCSSKPKAEGQNHPDSVATAKTAAVSLPKMLDLGSTTCIPCKQMAPILDSLKILYGGKAEIAFIDIREDKESARRYGITMIPTQLFFDTTGTEVRRHIGFFPADSITAQFEKLGVKL